MNLADAALHFLLLAGLHALCDYPLQGDFLARGKNHRNPLPGVPWYWCLFSHCAIHGLAVGLALTPALGIAEFFAHAATDYAKSEGVLSFDADQILHLVFKVLWVTIWILKNH